LLGALGLLLPAAAKIVAANTNTIVDRIASIFIRLPLEFMSHSSEIDSVHINPGTIADQPPFPAVPNTSCLTGLRSHADWGRASMGFEVSPISHPFAAGVK
jgi:hypothetical protein